MIPKFRISAIAVGLTTAMLLSGCGGGSSGEINQRDVVPSHPIDRINQSANTILMSDLVVSADLVGTDIRFQTNCNGATCSSGILGEQESLSISEFAEESEGTWPEAAETYRRVSIVRASAEIAGVGALAVFGGWLDHNYFFVAHATITDDEFGEVSAPVALTIGDATGTNPTSITGSAIWSGIMVGTDVSATATRSHQLRGDVDISIADFMNPSVDVNFSNIRDLNTDDSRTNITWSGIPIVDGSFQQGSDENSIHGAFFGPNHAEVGGVFESNEVVGAFGSMRQ